MSDIESLKRVLMATKAKARGMRKDKLEGRLNPKAPEAPLPEGDPAEEMTEPAADAMAEGDAPLELPADPAGEADPLAAPADPEAEEKAKAKAAILELLARV